MNRSIAACLLIATLATAVRVAAAPPWQKNVPRDLVLGIEKEPGPGIASRAVGPADFRIPRAGKMSIDADFDDWARAEWITLSDEPHLFGDNLTLDLTVEVPEGVTPTDDAGFLGFSYDQMTPSYEVEYLLDGFYGARGVVVTGVRPGSPAAEARLREGDVILSLAGKKVFWATELAKLLEERRQKDAPQSIRVAIQRNGRERFQGADDLSARIAFLVDDENLYFAARVTDDAHVQKMAGRDLWMNDSVQLSLDPTLERRYEGYGDDGHEIGFALTEGRAIAWCWRARRKMPRGLRPEIAVAVERRGNETLYEAAIPLAAVAPLSPDLWPHCGMNVVINDSDGGEGRKGRLELCPRATTHRKQPWLFADFEFEPSPDPYRLAAALFWGWGKMGPESRVRFMVAARSPKTARAEVTARLTSVSNPEAPPAEAMVEVPVGPEAREYMFGGWTRSQPGRYRITVLVRDPAGRTVVEDTIELPRIR